MLDIITGVQVFLAKVKWTYHNTNNINMIDYWLSCPVLQLDKSVCLCGTNYSR